MLHNKNIPKIPIVSGFVERFKQLSKPMPQLPRVFVAKPGDSPSVWDITNKVCDRHRIAHSC